MIESMRNHKPQVKYLHIRIDPELMRALKAAAAQNGLLMHQYVEAALRLCLSKKRGAVLHEV